MKELKSFQTKIRIISLVSGILLQILQSSRYLLVQIQQWEQQNNVRNLFKVKNKAGYY